MTEASWLYLHFPRLQLERQPASEAPLAIVCPQSLKIMQSNPAAHAQGVYAGMGFALACTLCDQLQVQPYRREKEVYALDQLAHSLYQQSAIISLFTPQGLALHIRPMLTYYGSLSTYWQTIRQCLAKEKITFCAAAATNPLAAKALAKAQTPCSESLTCPQLDTLALAYSDLPDKDVERLQRVGIITFGDLRQLSLSELSVRFDKSVIHYIKQVLGDSQVQLTSFTPEEYFYHYCELNYASNNSQIISQWLPHLLQELEAYLRKRTQVTQALTLTLYHYQAPESPLKVSAAQGQANASIWMRLLQVKLDQLSLTHPFYAFSLKAAPGQTLSPKTDLFDQMSAGATDDLLNLLKARLPSNAFFWPTPANDHRPEFNATDTIAPADTALYLRPAFLLARPQPLTGPLSINAGPERITSGWWDQHPVRRDYYMAQDKRGRQLWVYRELASGLLSSPWYLHGYFS